MRVEGDDGKKNDFLNQDTILVIEIECFKEGGGDILTVKGGVKSVKSWDDKIISNFLIRVFGRKQMAQLEERRRSKYQPKLWLRRERYS